MRKISIKRIISVKSSLEIAWDIVKDYTHFIPMHWRHFTQFNVIHSKDNISIFQTKARVMYPLPLTKTYISVRITNPNTYSFMQVYYCPDDKKITKTILKAELHQKNERIEIHSHTILTTQGLLSKFPMFITWLVDKRSRKMWLEDLDLINIRNQAEVFSDDACLPPIQSIVDFTHNQIANYDENLIKTANDTYHSEIYTKEDDPNSL